MRQPDYYTTRESGLWRPWPRDAELDAQQLAFRCTKHGSRVLVHRSGFVFHSLVWSSGKNKARWDCINGWTKITCYTVPSETTGGSSHESPVSEV
jgi:hypothetical protein